MPAEGTAVAVRARRAANELRDGPCGCYSLRRARHGTASSTLAGDGDVRMIDEAALTKGQLRKLNALRKSVGPAIADEAFSKWLEQSVGAPKTDENAEIISNALWDMIQEGRLSIRRGGYVVRRGRGRVIVEPREN